MRSLALKLTLAFLLVGISGAVLVALFVGLRTQREFDQFMLDRYRADLIEQLADYYEDNDGWSDLATLVMRGPNYRTGGEAYFRAPLTLLDADGTVLYSHRRFRIGQELSRQQARGAVPIKVDGQTIGAVLFDEPIDRNPAMPQSPEAIFRNRVNQAIALGALGATLFALLLGVLLARTISRPVQELTEATQAVARGALGHQVPVRTQDELGELAKSFNLMSADLAQASQLRRQMTADIAHELRTPLSVILGYTEALSDGKLQSTPRMFEAIHSEAALLSHLVDELRTLSLADAGELALDCEPTSPRTCLERTAAAHAALAQKQDVTLKVSIDEDLPSIRVDRERLAQVLGNLVSNALRYTPPGGTITLSATTKDDRVLLEVKDTGPGIEAEHLPFIFERFYRADESREQNGESGLGLAIARSLVEAQRGAIEVVSVRGQGTIFTISLPQNTSCS
jgi:signal transduction histidine kinase